MEQIQDNTRLDPKIWKVVAVVLLGPFMTQLDSTVVNVSLSTIRDDLNSTISAAQWIISAYLLTMALMLPLNGWLVDRIGAKRLYLGCFSLFTRASLFCGLASTMDQLIYARILQGVAGGLLAPMTQLMIARVAGRHMARVIGYAAVPVLLGPILGPVLAGAILKYAHWPWLFYINLPVGVIAVTLAFFLLPHDDNVTHRRPFDLLGLLTISPGLALALYGLEQIVHHEPPWYLIAGVLLLTVFFWHARRKNVAALIDLELFKNKIFATASQTQFLSNGIVYAGQFLIPLYLTTGVGLDAARTGWLMMPMGLGMMCAYPMMGSLTEKYGYRLVATTGVVLAFLGTLPFLWMSLHEFSASLTVICLFIRGAGQGATGIPSISAAYAAVPKEKLGLANTALNIVQRLGGPVATTVTALVMTMSASPGPSQGRGHEFIIPFIALNILQLLVITSASQLPAQIPHHK